MGSLGVGKGHPTFFWGTYFLFVEARAGTQQCPHDPSVLNTHRFSKPVMMMQACNPRAQEEEASLGSRDPHQQRQTGP